MTDPTATSLAADAAAPTADAAAPTAGAAAPTASTADAAWGCRPVEGHLVCARRHLLAAHRQRHRLTAHRHLRYARRHLLAAHPGVLEFAPDLRPPATPNPATRGIPFSNARATRRHLTSYRISCPARHSLPGARHLRLPCHRRLSACRHLQRAHRQLHQLQRGATHGLE